MSKDMKAVLLLALIVAGIVLSMWAVGIWLAEDASAGQWVNIEKFRGLSTHTNGLNRDMSVARGVDGWFVRNEGLVKPWFTKIRGNPVTTSPTYIVGHNSSSDRVLLYSDNFYSMTNGAIDPVGYAQTVRADSAYTLSTTDSIIYNWEDGNGSLVDTTFRGDDNWWLKWVLTTRSALVWDSLNFSVQFYSNRWVLNTGTAAQAVQTRPLGLPVATPSVDEGSGTLDLPIDSTLIFDGTYIWVYSGDTDSILNSSTTTVRAPLYADTGRVKNTYESGDSLILVIDPPDSVYTQATEFWILWDDSLLTSHATPCSIRSVIEYSTDSMRCIVLADTTKYKGVNHYHGRQNGSGAMHMSYLLYKPGAMTHYKFLGTTTSPPRGSIDSLTNLGSIAGIRYARFRTHARDGTGVSDLDVGFNSRTTDRNIWELTTDLNRDGSNDDTVFCMLIQYASTSTDFGTAYRWFDFLVWDTDTIDATKWGHGAIGAGAANNIYYRPRIGLYDATTNPKGWAITTISTTTSNDRFATIHRQRAFSSGNTNINATTDKRDSSLWVRFSHVVGPRPDASASTAGNYSVFPTANKFLLEGSDPVTGLSSMGQTLALYRRRGVSLLSGFSAADFYVQPAPVGQGAANHWCIARSPLHNQDVLTNENGIFFFGGAGLEPLSADIEEVFSDSINWYAESKIRGTVFDNMYFVTVPFDTDTTNTDMIGLDLETRNAWLMTKPRLSSVWNFRDDDGSEEWYGGDADSTVLWQLGGSSSDLYFVPEWKSSWSDLGDPDAHKRILSHRIEFDPSTYTDTLYVDWYLDLVDTLLTNDTVKTTPVWTDTIAVNTMTAALDALYPAPSDYPGNGIVGYTQARNNARGQDVERQTIQRPVSREVVGKYLSFGIRGRSVSARPLTIMRYGFEYTTLGERRK